MQAMLRAQKKFKKTKMKFLTKVVNTILAIVIVLLLVRIIYLMFTI